MIRKHLPNLCSLGSLAFGFAALESLMNRHGDWAVRHLLLALVLDLAAGRLALMLKARTAFGGELDQITGLATQGVVGMLLLWQACLLPLGWLGLVVAGLGAAAAAFRLSRHNAQTPERGEYRGLPLPVFGAVVILMAALKLPPAMALAGLVVLVFLLGNHWGYLRMPQEPLFPALTTLLLLLAAWGGATLVLVLGAVLAGLYALLGHVPPLKRLGFLKPASSPEEKTA